MTSHHFDFRDFAEVLRARAELTPQAPGFTFLDRSGETSLVWTYAELGAAAAGVAGVLRARLEPGERVLLLLPPGPEFVASLLGCWCAGAVPVPALPPEGAGAKRAIPRLAAIMADAGCRLGVTTGAIRRLLHDDSLAPVRSAHWLECEDFRPGKLEHDGGRHEHPALLQYTSGSTGTPKGVVLTHRNLLANAEQIRRAFGHDERSQGVIWLPPQHDMGLVGGILQPLFVGFPVALMSPMTFLQRPLRWLQAISRFRATTSGGPDFAYRMCVERIDEVERAGLDLSSWQVAFTGSELVRASTIDAFSAAFAASGFRQRAFYPCYGLAEATLMVSGPQLLHGAGTFAADRGGLSDGALRPAPESPEALRLVSCGSVLDGQQLVIVRPGTSEPLSPGLVGEVLCRGPNVAAGYWQNPDASRETFDVTVTGHGAGFMRTGDLGCLHEGQLFIAGRIKELIIARGRNHYAGDLEATLDDALLTEDVPVAALCVFSEQLPRERITLCVELRGPRERCVERAPAIARSCRRALSEQHGLVPERVVFLRPGAIPKTTSGKLRRGAMRDALSSGEADVVALDEQSETIAAASLGPSMEPPRTTQDVRRWLVDYAARKRGVPEAEIDVHTPFSGFGLDSLEAVTVAAALAEWVGRPVPATALWDHPTIQELSDFIFNDAARDGDEPAADSQIHARQVGPIAIVGMACRVAGAKDTDEFWRLLQAGERVTAKAPPRRPGAAALDALGLEAGYLDDVDYFDAAHFQISADEARAMDPQQRILLEVAWEALESAGVNPQAFRGSNCGVFVGISNVDYGRLTQAHAALNVFAGSGNSFAIAANRISYAFDLSGPSLAVDTACSSSLVAVHLACRAIRAGECEMALAGGVNLILTPELSRVFESAGMLSASSRCSPFESVADGYVRGEGCGVVVLKPLDRALADGDRIFSVIRGSAVNQDGKSNGLTAPNGSAQRSCIESALLEAGVHGSELGYVEAHGTGTPLGDPIEFRTLADVCGGAERREPCWVGAVKANIGHLESAAGVVGLIKAALVLDRQVVPPQPEFGEPNPRLDGDPQLRLARSNEAAPAPLRLAGVSSFGFGGTNAHIVLGRGPEAPTSEVSDGIVSGPWCVRISARTQRAARALAARYADSVSRRGVDGVIALMRVSLLRRSRYADQTLLVAEDVPELERALIAFSRGEHAPQLRAETRRELHWVCAGLEAPLAVVDAWSEALPELGRLFHSHIKAFPEAQRSPQALEFAAHRALCEALGELGVEPLLMTGSGVGEVAAAAWACALGAAEGARLLSFVLGDAERLPPPAYVSSTRRLLGSNGMRLERVDALELRERFEQGQAPTTREPALVWGAPAAAAAESALLPLSVHEATPHTLLECLVWAEQSGCRVDWRAYLSARRDAATHMPRVAVPTYAFDRERYWLVDEPEFSGHATSRLELCWQERALPAAPRAQPGSWLVLGEQAAGLAIELQRLGVSAQAVDSTSALQQQLSGMERGGVLFCAHGSRTPLARQLLQLVDVFQLVEAAPQAAAGLRVVTQQAYAPNDDEAVRPEQTAVWGLLRSLSWEHPNVPLAALDVAPGDVARLAQELARELPLAADESRVLRASRRWVARLRPSQPERGELARCPGETWLITGGLGALGLALAQEMAARGAARLVLVGRDPTRQEPAVAALRRQGVEVLVERCDLSRDHEPLELLESLARRAIRLDGVVHAAGQLADGVITAQTEESLGRALGPKALGAQHLVQALEKQPPRRLAFVSSIAGTTGAPGQGGYGAANAYLDGLAAELCRRGLSVCSVALGPVDAGMGKSGARAASALGLGKLSSADAASALAQAVLQPRDFWQLLAGPVDDSTAHALATPALRALTEDWLRLAPAAPAPDALQELRAHGPRGAEFVSRWLQERVAEALHRPAHEVAVDRGLLELGLDSLLVLQLRARIEQAFGLRLQPAALFSHPTIRQLAAHLLERVVGTTVGPAPLPLPATRVHPAGGAEDFLSALEAMDDAQAIRMTEEVGR